MTLISRLNHLGTIRVLNIKICKGFCLKLNKYSMSNFHPLEVVDRGSKIQPQVGEFFKLFNLTF